MVAVWGEKGKTEIVSNGEILYLIFTINILNLHNFIYNQPTSSK